MFRLMRNIHLWLGLAFVVMAMIFALSSLFVIYRPWLPDEATETSRTVRISPQSAGTPRGLARELIRNHGLKGELLGVEETAEAVKFRISRPGTEHRVEYERATGEAKIADRRWGLGQTLLQIHVTHGFWRESPTAWVWALLSFLSSAGLLLLGASGIYLWFAHHKERLIGGVLLALGLGWGLTTLALTRMAS
jgi:hypothetical protein